MYADNFGDRHFHLGDIHKIDPADIPTCDLFTASFPCNDLSIAGAQSGLSGKESSAFWGLIQILKEMKSRRPPIVMLENVVGFLQSHGGRDFETALISLNDLGYAVDAFILNAKHWVPQSRARMFVIATMFAGTEIEPDAGAADAGGGAVEIALTPAADYKPAPAAGHAADVPDQEIAADPSIERVDSGAASPADSSAVRPAALTAFIESHPNIRWRLRDLPPLPRGKARLASIVEDLPDDDKHWWSPERAEYFFGQLSERHLRLANELIAGETVSYSTAFRRVRNGRSMAELRADGIAGCLRTPRGGSGRQILFKAGAGRYQVRLLTARECARLQGVPDDYKINVRLNQALFGFGDAVCVPTVAWIAKHYLTPLAAEIVVQEPDLFTAFEPAVKPATA
jgi:DNA (cytosine-5)-methyltransferase 1